MPQFDRDLTLVPILIALAGVCTLIAIDQSNDGRIWGGSLGLAAAVFAAMLVRQLLIARDRTRLARELHASLLEQERLAVTDVLTGLYNRRFFEETLHREAQRCGQTQQPMSLVILDIDHFTEINETLGHPVGDFVLVAVADRIRRTARNRDVVARYAGEEFVCLVTGSGEAGAIEAAERLRQAVRAPLSTPGLEIPVAATVSIGVAAAVGQTPIDVEELVVRAERALYAAKQAGPDHIECAAPPAGQQQRAPGS